MRYKPLPIRFTLHYITVSTAYARYAPKIKYPTVTFFQNLKTLTSQQHRERERWREGWVTRKKKKKKKMKSWREMWSKWLRSFYNTEPLFPTTSGPLSPPSSLLRDPFYLPRPNPLPLELRFQVPFPTSRYLREKNFGLIFSKKKYEGFLEFELFFFFFFYMIFFFKYLKISSLGLICL